MTTRDRARRKRPLSLLLLLTPAALTHAFVQQQPPAAAAPTTTLAYQRPPWGGGPPYCQNDGPFAPYQPGGSGGLVLAASKSSSSEPSPPAAAAEPKKRKSGWDRFKGVMNKAQEVAASDDFRRLAKGARTLLKEVDIDLPHMDETLERLKNSVDRRLSKTMGSFEMLLQLYEGRSPEIDKLIGMSRGRVQKMVQGGLHALMSPTAVEWAVYAVNSTALLVEEQAARVLRENQDSSTSMMEEPTFQEAQREVMKRMVVVAEDAEALAWSVIDSSWFRSGYSAEELVQFESLLHARLVPRLVLAVSAAVLHGWRPLEDPLLALLVVGYASGSVTRSVAGNFMALFERSLLGGEAVLREEGKLMDQFPDVWRTRESAQEIGEGLFRLFEALEKRSATRLEAQAAQARANMAVPPSSSLPSIPPLPPREKKFMVASYALPNKLTSLAGGGDGGVDGGNARNLVYYPAFTSTRQGKTLLYLTKTVHVTRSYWKQAAAAMLGTVGLVFLAKLYGTPASLTVTLDGTDNKKDGLLNSSPIEGLDLD